MSKLPGLVTPTLDNPNPVTRPMPDADGDVPVTDAAGVPIRDESADADRSRSPRGVLQDFDEMDLGADLARIMECDQAIGGIGFL